MEIAGFLGAVLEPGDERFETARQIWNRGHPAPAGRRRLLYGNR